MNTSRSLMGRKQVSRAVLGFALLALGIGSSPTTVAATTYTSGPVYGGAFTWTTPALRVVPPTGSGFLGVAAFRGRFVAVERNAVASTSIDGATWVGHALPGPGGAARNGPDRGGHESGRDHRPGCCVDVGGRWHLGVDVGGR